jgi:hypothetical protein
MDPNFKLIHARAYNVPILLEQQLQQIKEIVRLVDIGVLEEDYSSEWASPSFAIPKKNGTVRVVTDFRKTSTQFIVETSKPPISYPKDRDVIRSIEGFSFASALDLNMDYYHIKLDADAQTYVPLYSHRENTNTNAYSWVSRLPES